jgi:hypothetical protein
MAWPDMTTAAKATIGNPDIRRRHAAIGCGHGSLSRKQSLGRRFCGSFMNSVCPSCLTEGVRAHEVEMKQVSNPCAAAAA